MRKTSTGPPTSRRATASARSWTLPSSSRRGRARARRRSWSSASSAWWRRDAPRCRSIAAITFTEAAAAELRDRVREELEKAARDESLPPDERERCRAALDEVDAAAIETLHGFAQRILSAHPLEAGLPPLIEVQDEIRSSIAFEERWSEFVDRLLDDPALEEVLLRAHVLGLETKHLREVAREFHSHWDRLEDAAIEAAPLPPLDASAAPRRPRQTLRAHGALQRPRRLAVPSIWSGWTPTAAVWPRPKATSTRSASWRRGRRSSTSTATKTTGQASRPARSATLFRRVDGIRDRLLQEARAAVLPPLLAALRGFILQYAEERRRAGQARVPRPPGAGARPAAPRRLGAAGAARRNSPISSSTSSRTPTRSRSRSPCCSPAATPTARRPPGRRRRSRRGGSSSSATPSSRSTASAAPTSRSTRRCSAASPTAPCGSPRTSARCGPSSTG